MAGPGHPIRGDGPDLLTAAIFVATGGLGLWLARDLDAGTMAQMGAAWLPRAVCIALILVGAAVGLSALRRAGVAIEPVKLRPVAVITVAIVGFAYAATHAGFVLAALWLIIAGSLADPGGNWRHTLLLAAGLTAFGALVFVYGLGVQVPLWPF
jgi:putative tricarboxylic transport membrane protein